MGKSHYGYGFGGVLQAGLLGMLIFIFGFFYP